MKYKTDEERWLAKRAAQERYRKKNMDKWRKYFRQYKSRFPEKIKQLWDSWSKRNKEKLRERDKARLEIPGYNAAKCMRRHTRKLRATVSWANDETVKCYYEFAALKSQITGEKWVVDHIVPLRGKSVCGLHTDYNLQVIKQSDNLRKSNRVWPDMP